MNDFLLGQRLHREAFLNGIVSPTIYNWNTIFIRSGEWFEVTNLKGTLSSPLGAVGASNYWAWELVTVPSNYTVTKGSAAPTASQYQTIYGTLNTTGSIENRGDNPRSSDVDTAVSPGLRVYNNPFEFIPSGKSIWVKGPKTIVLLVQITNGAADNKVLYAETRGRYVPDYSVPANIRDVSEIPAETIDVAFADNATLMCLQINDEQPGELVSDGGHLEQFPEARNFYGMAPGVSLNRLAVQANQYHGYSRAMVPILAGNTVDGNGHYHKLQEIPSGIDE